MNLTRLELWQNGISTKWNLIRLRSQQTRFHQTGIDQQTGITTDWNHNRLELTNRLESQQTGITTDWN
jgi:hypothetical protein